MNQNLNSSNSYNNDNSIINSSNSSNSVVNDRKNSDPNTKLTNFFKNDYTNNSTSPNSLIPNIQGKSITKLTNKHTTSSNNVKKSKRSTTSRACDACAIRKVKCDPNTPCNHCEINNLICTRNRQRKKSGPKSLAKKTLDSINNLSEVIELNSNKKSDSLNIPSHAVSKSPSFIEDEQQSSNQSSPPVSHKSSIVQSITPNNDIQSNQIQESPEVILPVTTIQESLTPNNSSEDYLVTPAHLIENLRLLGDEPCIFELVKPLTVDSILLNYSKLIQFLEINYPDSTTTNNPYTSEINLVKYHENSLFLSQLLIIITLNQIIAEMLIKLKKQKFKNFKNYSKKNLMFRPFKNFKNLCHFKVLEILTLIEKNFIVPPIIPKMRSDKTNQFCHLNQYQIYFNLSLSNIQLSNYYNILNLTNSLNSTNDLNNSYGNEAQEHQKILYLNKAISFFQLINLKDTDPIKPFKELYELIFIFERYYIIFSSFSYGWNIFRNNDMILKLTNSSLGAENSSFLFKLLKFIDDEKLIEDICKNSNFNITLNYQNEDSKYYVIKNNLLELLKQTSESIEKLLIQILLFKILLINPLNFENCKKEIYEILFSISIELENSNNDLFKIKISNYQVLQPLLHILKIFLEIKQKEVKLNLGMNLKDQNLLVRYSELLILHLPFFNNINKLIRSHKILNNWFLMLSEIKKDKDDQPESPQQQQQSPQQQLQPQPVQQFQPYQQQILQQPQTPITNLPLHTGITPEQPQNFNNNDQLSFTNLNNQFQSMHQKIASQIDINELLKDFNVSKFNDDSNSNSNQNLINLTPIIQYKPDDEDEEEEELEEKNENDKNKEVNDESANRSNLEEEEEENDFFSIRPKNEHGHKFINSNNLIQQSIQQKKINSQFQQYPITTNSNSNLNQNFTIPPNQSSSIINLNNLNNASTRSFLSLLNAANYIEDEENNNNNFNLNQTISNNEVNYNANKNNGNKPIGDSSFFNLNNLG
ncbi:uncharacterized protein KGF55_000038 [Candida pseudojiufengensis]|uniref:uncharacterized protein n=1 Tax=Candida pseudojiufengensis TaxID=497109 RepID=UPI00222491CC|nr:uncharacterized protein KGF55_000038 [Candida pseudojiufengensis]KAI5968054.1 hypothetical protein KGF55_000038 [Candida pseudojiufengensis]